MTDGPINTGAIRDMLPLRAGEIPMCECGCNEVFFECSDHPKAGCGVAFNRTENVLLVWCHKCKGMLCKVKVEK